MEEADVKVAEEDVVNSEGEPEEDVEGVGVYALRKEDSVIRERK